MRKDGTGKKDLLFVINLTPLAREGFRVGVPRAGTYKKLFDSSEKQYGGTAASHPAKSIHSKVGECDWRAHCIGFDLPPYAALVYLIPDVPSEAGTKTRERIKNLIKPKKEKQTQEKKQTRKYVAKKGDVA